MHIIDELQLYISDRCDLACEGCITYNNWAWGSRLKIQDHREEFLAWQGQIRVNSLTILGGEPMLNPELDQWVTLVMASGMAASLRICTNGGHQDRWQHAWTDQGCILEISSHSEQDLESALEWCRDRWPAAVQSQRRAEGSQHADMMIYHFHSESTGQLLAEVRSAWQFNQWPWQLNQGQITWDRLRDPVREYEHCAVKDCAYMMGSRLYRCPQQALFPRITPWVDSEYAGVTSEDLGVSADGPVAEWFATRFHWQSQCSLCNWQEPRVATLDSPRHSKITLVPRAEYQRKQLNT